MFSRDFRKEGILKTFSEEIKINETMAHWKQLTKKQWIFNVIAII